MNQCAVSDIARLLRIGEILLTATQRLSAAGVDTARLDGEVLLAHALEISHERLLVSGDLAVGDMALARFERSLVRRLAREPVAYITGRQEFWSLDFNVNCAVLIPRPDTERLVEVALSLAGEARSDMPLRVLDIGTGSGAIAVSLARELPLATLYATDLSEAALAVARGNAILNGVAERIAFYCGDLFGALADETASFDLIVANPPYVRRAEIAMLEPEVSYWEPRSALDGGADGLDYYRRMAAQAWLHLGPNGAVALEIGADMAEATTQLLIDARRYTDIRTYQDYAGRERVVAATKLA